MQKPPLFQLRLLFFHSTVKEDSFVNLFNIFFFSILNLWILFFGKKKRENLTRNELFKIKIIVIVKQKELKIFLWFLMWVSWYNLFKSLKILYGLVGDQLNKVAIFLSVFWYYSMEISWSFFIYFEFLLINDYSKKKYRFYSFQIHLFIFRATLLLFSYCLTFLRYTYRFKKLLLK